MKPKSTTALGRTLEDRVAKDYNGLRSRSSGAAAGRKGDVSYTLGLDKTGTDYWEDYDYLAECKTTEAQSISVKRSVWEKIAQEAREQSRRPCMFLRFYDSETGKHLDLVVRDVNDDLEMIK